MGSWHRAMGWGGLLTFAAGAAITAAVVSCGKGGAKPMAYAPPPPETGSATTSTTSVATMEAAEDANIFPIDPLQGQQVATRMPDGQVWARYPNGMAYRDIKSGVSAEPQPGNNVYIFYKAWVARTGKVFAQSEKGKPWHFRLGSDAVPPGVNMAVYAMERAGKRQWWIPAKFAFGAKGLPPDVGPNEDVIYEIELQQWDGRSVQALPRPREPLGPPAPYELTTHPAKLPFELSNLGNLPTTNPGKGVGPSSR